MRFKRFFMQYGLSQTLLLSFAFANALLPPGYITVFIVIYILIFGALMYYFTRKMIKGRVKDIDVVKKAKRIFRAKAAEVRQLMTRDRLLISEMKGQFLSMILPFIAIFILLILIPHLRGFIVGEAEKLEFFERLIRYVILYETFFAVSMISRLGQSIMVKRRGFTTLMVLNDYVVTEKGIYSEAGAGLSLTFPLKAKNIVCNEKRNFVDLDIVQEAAMAGRSVTRIRLYTKKPRDLYNKLKDFVEIGE
ncbi:MAG: hypothetical protein DRO23_02225 [Thermoprotei archaeon]|nr:MAG: hypothetical protein DRO23_02225 [Thermoprotei archaeon]